MALTAAGVGSGLDVESIVSQLMRLEQRPLSRLQSQESDYRAQLSAYGRLKSSLSSFQTAMQELSSMDKFKVFSTSSSDEDVLTATADSDAAAGIYSLEVTRLAQNHKMGSAEYADTDLIGGGGTDSLDIAIGSDSFSIDLSTAKTLSAIRDEINSATDNPGVTATIINTGAGTQRLVLTSDESGYEKRLQVTESISSNPLNLTTINTDQLGNPMLTDLQQQELDAAFTIDGYDITASSNNVSGVVDGITLNLKQVGSANLTLERNTESIEKSVQSFVDAYNKVVNTVRELRAGDLEADRTTLSVMNQLRNVLNTAPVGLTGSYSALSQIGIATDPKVGTLSLNSSDLAEALDSDFQSVAELFAHDDQGVAFRFDALVEGLLDSEGIIDAREEGINARIDSLETQQSNWEYRLEMREKTLRARFSALDALVGQMQSTSSFLTQQLG